MRTAHAVARLTVAVLTVGLALAGPAPVSAVAVPLAGPDNEVTAWGRNYEGQASVPAGLTGVIGVAAGGNHSLAVKSDGTVVAWGENTQGQSTVPAGLTGVIAVAAGDSHSLALKSDGTVVAWGYNADGQTDVPAGLTGVVDVAAGAWHSLALKSDGTVVAWGLDRYGQGSVPDGLTDVVAVAAGGYHNLAVKADGTVIAWGNNGSGEASVPGGLTDVVAVAAGNSHSLAAKADGTVVAWGWNYYGQTDVPGGLTDVVAVAAGDVHSLALKADGTVVAWGDDESGQASVPAGLTNVAGIAAGRSHSLAIAPVLPAIVAFNPVSILVEEHAGPLPLTVVRTGNTAIAATVHFAPGNGTATLGSDFSLAAGTVEFAPYETTKQFDMQLLDDTIGEAPEDAIVQLNSPGVGTTLGEQCTATVTIIDDEHAVVAFTAAGRSVQENAATVQLAVTRTGNTATTHTMAAHYDVTGGTAAAGSDYTLIAGDLSFAAGQSSATIPVRINNDAAREAPETIVVTLSSPGAGTELGTPASMTVTIQASDQRPDGWISTASGRGYVGNNVYNTTGVDQTRTLNARRAQYRDFYVRVYNDGNATNTFTLKGSAAVSGSTVRYYAGSTSITTAMRSAAGYRVTLKAGAYKQLRVRITVGSSAAIGSAKPATVTAKWTGDGTRTDVVKAVVTVVR